MCTSIRSICFVIEPFSVGSIELSSAIPVATLLLSFIHMKHNCKFHELWRVAKGLHFTFINSTLPNSFAYFHRLSFFDFKYVGFKWNMIYFYIMYIQTDNFNKYYIWAICVHATICISMVSESGESKTSRHLCFYLSWYSLCVTRQKYLNNTYWHENGSDGSTQYLRGGKIRKQTVYYAQPFIISM